MKKMLFVFFTVSIFMSLLVLAGCGNGEDSSTIIVSSNFSISGTVTSPNGVLPGVTVSIDGATVTTDNDGKYTFSGLTNGSYNVTPSVTGYTFSPNIRSITINGENSVAQDFTASNGYGTYTSDSISPSEFITALNILDGTTQTTVVGTFTKEPLRSQQLGQGHWFVIWDAKFGEYKAVNLNYIRTIVYYDYSSNNQGAASEFRSIERSDILSGLLNGDYYGNDYEVLDFHALTGYYEGRNSGYLY